MLFRSASSAIATSVFSSVGGAVTRSREAVGAPSPAVTVASTSALAGSGSAAIRTGNRFGAAHLTDVLLGRATEKVVSMNHHTLPTFGVGAAAGITFAPGGGVSPRFSWT